MQNMEKLLSIQVYAECGKSTFDSSICRMCKIKFKCTLKLQILLSIQVHADCGKKYMKNVENLHSNQVYYAESGKSTFDASTCRMWKIYFRLKYLHDVENLLSIQVYVECRKSTFDSSMQNVENRLSVQIYMRM